MPENLTTASLAQSPQHYWNTRYAAGQTGWDLNAFSPPLIHWIDQIADANAAILLPGAGAAHELHYLWQKGFTHVTMLDIAPLITARVKESLPPECPYQILTGDFFEHTGAYDYILEQTFFCALLPALRPAYVQKMASLLRPKGHLQGVLFDKQFENSPPFSGSREEYEALFAPYFEWEHLETCTISVAPRAGTELLFSAHLRHQ